MIEGRKMPDVTRLKEQETRSKRRRREEEYLCLANL